MRVVAGACVGRWTGQPTAAAGGAAARGVRGDWGILLRLDWEPLRERTLDHRSGQTRMPPQERRHEEVFGLGDSFTCSGETARGGFDFLFWGALSPFVLRVVAGACVGRWTGQPTAAAGGAAARGVRGDWGILLRLDWEPLRERTLDHRSGQTRMPPQERRHEEVFGLGDSFTCSGETARGGFDFLFWGALSPFVLRVVAGACVGRWTGQPTAAAGGAAARGVRGDWGILLRLDWEPLRERTLDHRSGQTRMPPQERRHEEVFGLGGLFHTHGSDCTRGVFVWGDYFAVLWRTLSPFVLRACCGGMCWPVDRPATHAAAGAAARGF